jgi:hypothetical protein
VELRASLLKFRKPLTSPFHKSILTGLSAFPTLCKELNKCTTLAHRFNYIFIKNKKSPPSKKDGRPVVPPSLAKNQLTLPISKQLLLEYLPLVTMRISPKPTDPIGGSVWRLRSPFTNTSTLIFTNHQLSRESVIVTTLHQCPSLLIFILNQFRFYCQH